MPYRTGANGGTCGHDEPRQESSEIWRKCQSAAHRPKSGSVRFRCFADIQEIYVIDCSEAIGDIHDLIPICSKQGCAPHIIAKKVWRSIETSEHEMARRTHAC